MDTIVSSQFTLLLKKDSSSKNWMILASSTTIQNWTFFFLQIMLKIIHFWMVIDGL